jgi:molybdopterin-guanine dinucleotide biosynthesis protein B
MKVVSIVGWSGSGKTTLITRLIAELRGRGRRVIAVKGTHAAYDVQPEGKDTARFRRAGAEEAYLLAGPELLRMTASAGAGELLAELGSRLGADDVVLMEGLTVPGVPVIEVAGGEPGKGLKTRPGELAALVAAEPAAKARRCFGPDEIKAIAAFVEENHGS